MNLRFCRYGRSLFFLKNNACWYKYVKANAYNLARKEKTMAVEKVTKVNDVDEAFYKKVNWLDFGLKMATHVSVAIATGYLTSVGNDLYMTRKAKKLSKRKDSNLLLLGETKAS